MNQLSTPASRSLRSASIVNLACERDTHSIAMLAGILENAGETAQFRRLAAMALGRIADENSENVLRKNLHRVPAEVAPDVILSLGRIGGPGAIDYLESGFFSRSLRERDATRFAIALIAHRLGLPDHDWPADAMGALLDAPGAHGREIRIGTLAGAEAELVSAGLAARPYGISYEPAAFAKLECMGQTSVIALRGDLRPKGATERLATRKALLGVVALRSQESDDYGVSHLILTAPDAEPSRLRILVVRNSGRLAFRGAGTIEGDTVAFQLNAVRRPGARPIAVSGRMRFGALEIHVAKVGPKLGKESLKSRC